MSSYWVNFVKTGDPNGPGLPGWPAFSATDDNVQYLGDTITTGDVANLRQLKDFDSVYDGVRGAPFGMPSAP